MAIDPVPMLKKKLHKCRVSVLFGVCFGPWCLKTGRPDCVFPGSDSCCVCVLGWIDVGYHRIIEWFVLEGTLKIIWFQPPCHEQGHLPPGCSELHPTWPEPCQGGGSHSFSGQPGPVFHHPHGEEFLPNV